MLRITGTYSYLNLHGKEKSRKRGWTSHLGIDLGTSPIAGRARPTVPILAPQKQVKTQSSIVESLPDPVGIVFPKIEWCSLIWSFFSSISSTLLNEEDIDTSLKGSSCSPNYHHLCLTHMSRPALTNISSYLSGSYISFCHFPNVRTEYVQPRKSLQVDFPKSEKENFVEGIVTPCLLRVQSRRTGHEIQSHACNYAYSISNSGLNRSLSVSSRHICKDISFVCPRNFTEEWKTIFSEDLEVGCREALTLAETKQV